MRVSRSISYAFLVACFSVCAHTPEAFSPEQKYQVGVSVMNLHASPSATASYETQAIYGQTIYVLEKVDEEWALFQTEDGAQAYGQLSCLVEDNPSYRFTHNQYQVSSVAGMVYPIEDKEDPAWMRLPFGTKIKLLVPLESNENRWLPVELLDGRQGWMQRGDLEKPRPLTIEEMLVRAPQFLELPYIWGGTSSEGFDCSGYAQTMVRQTGTLLPRNSSRQAKSDHVYEIDQPEKPGDLVFFHNPKTGRINHVMIYLQDGKCIHSGVLDRRPKTTYANLEATEYVYCCARRIKALNFEPTIQRDPWELDDSVLQNSLLKDVIPSLNYVTVQHFGQDGCVHEGELLVPRDLAWEITRIFEKLYTQRYPIEKMRIKERYVGGLIAANGDNSSHLDFRLQQEDEEILCEIRINPVLHTASAEECAGVITEGDNCHKAFTNLGWRWGGAMDGCSSQSFYKTCSID